MVRLRRNILVANLASNFQDLVTKVKNLVTLAPVLGAISRPATSPLNYTLRSGEWRDYHQLKKLLIL